jgi:hypothetical protein
MAPAWTSTSLPIVDESALGGAMGECIGGGIELGLRRVNGVIAGCGD